MKEIYIKHKKSAKILFLIFCLVFFAGKILYDFSPFILIKTAFVNTLNMHKSVFYDSLKESNSVSAELRYETGIGNEKIINAVFYDSLVGFSLDGADSVYYTIPVDNIKKLLKSDYISDLFTNPQKTNKISNPIFAIPSFFSVKFDKNIDLRFLSKVFSEIKMERGKASFLSDEKSFSFLVPAELVSEFIGRCVSFDADSEKMLKSYLIDMVYVKGGDYLFDIAISDNSLKSITCITPCKNNMSYHIYINFDYTKISLGVENLVNESKKCIFSMQSLIYETKNQKTVELDVNNDLNDATFILTLTSAKNRKDSKIREKSIYSLTIGDLLKISKTVSKDR